MRDVFVKVSQDQKQFQHSIALVRSGAVPRILQIVNDGERVGKQPFQRLGVNSLSHPAALKRLIRADKSFIQKVIEAELFGH
ncbi:MAG: hypothetical protein ACRD8A_14585 [Candidatus Acidiferrales bacterium]